jgi:hypothetical protein
MRKAAMEGLETREKILASERDVLRAMCQGTREGPVRAEGLAILAAYRFADSVHQLVFDTLRQIPSDSPPIIRQQLTGRLNNKGFPDLDLDTFFEPHNISAEQARAQMHGLRAAAGDAPSNSAAR